jgi:endonuclease YncB( thermonuclease family)
MNELPHEYDAEVLDVHDGDTVYVRVDAGFETDVRVWLRLKGVFAPELATGLLGDKARTDLLNLCPVGTNIRIKTYKVNSKKRWTEFKRTFVRYVATLWVSDGTCVNDLLNKQKEQRNGTRDQKLGRNAGRQDRDR